MSARSARLLGGATLACFLSAAMMSGQAGAVLSGTISDSSGKPVPQAQVTVVNTETGQSTQTQTDSAGSYRTADLRPGDYQISASAPGLAARSTRVAITAGASATVSLTLNGVALSLEDLGFSEAQAQGSDQNQALLDKRSHMLKMHQKFGLIATIPLIATVIAGGGAGGMSTSSTGRNIHAALGSLSFSLYATSAYYAIFAPKIPGTTTRGPIRLHKALAWIHGVGMVLTPVLGIMAYEQKSRGEKVHGLANAHGAVGIVTVAAYGASILSVSKKF